MSKSSFFQTQETSKRPTSRAACSPTTSAKPKSACSKIQSRCSKSKKYRQRAARRPPNALRKSTIAQDKEKTIERLLSYVKFLIHSNNLILRANTSLKIYHALLRVKHLSFFDSNRICLEFFLRDSIDIMIVKYQRKPFFVCELQDPFPVVFDLESKEHNYYFLLK